MDPSHRREDGPALVVGSLSSEHIRIQPRGRTHPNVADYWDGNWLTCEIGVRAGAFKGRVEAQLRTEELAHFCDELRALSDRPNGQATFKTVEDWIRVSVIGDSGGQLSARCEVRDNPAGGNRLLFELSFDQAVLAKMIEGLEHLVREFPVVGKP